MSKRITRDQKDWDAQERSIGNVERAIARLKVLTKYSDEELENELARRKHKKAVSKWRDCGGGVSVRRIT